MGITNVTQFLKETGCSYLREMLEQAARKNLRRNCGRTRYVLEGKELESFNFQYTFGNLTNPRVVIGNNSSKGSSLWGATIYDNAGKPVDSYAICYDITRGKEPIIQSRWQKFHDGKKVFTETEYTDYNKVVNDNSNVVTNIVEENGVLRGSASIDDVYSYSASSSLNNAETAAIESEIDIYMQSKDWVKQTVTDYSDIQRRKDIMKSLKRQFHYRPSYFQKKIRLIDTMDLSAVAKETEIQTQKMKQAEQELENLYSEIVGTESGTRAWREDFINEKLPKVNVKTGRRISRNEIQKLRRKINKYSDARNLLMMLTQRKLELTKMQIHDGKFLSQALKRYGIKTENTIDKELLSKLNAIKDSPQIEAITRAKDIICDHLKLSKDSIKIVEATEKHHLEPYTMAFMPQIGEIAYHPTIAELPTDAVIALIRHELDHAEVFAKTAKSIGQKEFKNLISKGHPEVEKFFNDEFWTGFLKNVEVGDFDTKFYVEAIKNYKSFRQYNLRQNISYMSNPLEQRAYRAGFDTQSALSGEQNALCNSAILIKSKIYAQLEEKIKELKSILGGKMDEHMCVETLYQRALRMVENPTSVELSLEVDEKMLELINKGIQKAKNGNLNYPKTK